MTDVAAQATREVQIEHASRREALLYERDKYVQAGRLDRAKLVDEEIERHDAAAPPGQALTPAEVEHHHQQAVARAERQMKVAALVREHEFAKARGQHDRAALINEEIRRLTSEREPPRSRAAKRSIRRPRNRDGEA